MVSTDSGSNVEDPASFFAKVFGGDRFMDYIGETLLMKDVTNVANTMLSEEEKAELDAAGVHLCSPYPPDPHPYVNGRFAQPVGSPATATSASRRGDFNHRPRFYYATRPLPKAQSIDPLLPLPRRTLTPPQANA